MIMLHYIVDCDGHDEDDDRCEARFSHSRYGMVASPDLFRQLAQRGWRITTLDPLRVLCPLHPEDQP